MLSGTLPGGSSNFGYDAFGRLESIVHPSGTGNFQRDLLDRITQLTWSGATPISEALGYDLAGNITSLERENSSASTIAYDAVNQILSSVGGSAEVRSYTRDMLGNRLQDSVNGAGTFVSNFLSSNGLATYTADPNGFGQIVQEVKGGVTKNYTYRADGLLSGFQSGSTQVASYYDALGRLAARAINDGANSYTQSYAYIGTEPTLLQAKAGDGTITSFLSGQGPNTYIAESKNGIYKGYVIDHAGSILNSALAGPTHRYGLHGEPTGTAALSPTSDPAMLGWQGLRYNPESGNWDNLRRDYNPSLGTFTSQDPLGVDGGLNLYGSRNNNPLSNVDPTGEFWWLIGIGVGMLGYDNVANTPETPEEPTEPDVGMSGPAMAAGLTVVGGRVIQASAELACGGAAAAKYSLSSKIAKQMRQRGWTQEMIERAVAKGEKYPAVNRANGNPATRYVDPKTGQSVVIDNVTGQPIHVGGPGFKYGSGSGDVGPK